MDPYYADEAYGEHGGAQQSYDEYGGEESYGQEENPGMYDEEGGGGYSYEEADAAGAHEGYAEGDWHASAHFDGDGAYEQSHSDGGYNAADWEDGASLPWQPPDDFVAAAAPSAPRSIFGGEEGGASGEGGGFEDTAKSRFAGQGPRRAAAGAPAPFDYGRESVVADDAVRRQVRELGEAATREASAVADAAAAKKEREGSADGGDRAGLASPDYKRDDDNDDGGGGDSDHFAEAFGGGEAGGEQPTRGAVGSEDGRDTAPAPAPSGLASVGGSMADTFAAYDPDAAATKAGGAAGGSAAEPLPPPAAASAAAAFFDPKSGEPLTGRALDRARHKAETVLYHQDQLERRRRAQQRGRGGGLNEASKGWAGPHQAGRMGRGQFRHDGPKRAEGEALPAHRPFRSRDYETQTVAVPDHAAPGSIFSYECVAQRLGIAARITQAFCIIVDIELNAHELY